MEEREDIVGEVFGYVEVGSFGQMNRFRGIRGGLKGMEGIGDQRV